MARPSVIAANLTITAGNNALRILLKINNRALYTGDRAATFIDQGLNVTQATPGEAGKAIRDRANAGIQRISDLPERTQGGAGIRHEVTGIVRAEDRKSTRLNSSHVKISYAVFCLKKKKNKILNKHKR